MYDLSRDFENFYNDCVKLPLKEQQELRQKRDINLSRLREGLSDYNSENKTNYKMAETRTQGSMAMHTTVQNDKKDYDIDVAVVFDKDNLNGLGPLATRNMVASALRKKCKSFNVEPEVKTNCVRIIYADGYHVDFAIYQRYKENVNDSEYKYEHAGSSWTSRNPAAINDWFCQEISEHGDNLRKIIRLSKMFCKSRESWVNMAAGLIQTVVCDEKIQSYDRLDEAFYHTMAAVKNRLEDSTEVMNPTDSSISLLQTDNHKTKVINWKNRLSDKISELEVLFENECTKIKAREAWYKFFNHDFWYDDASAIVESISLQKSYEGGRTFRNTEEFIEEDYIIDEQYTMRLKCIISRNGFREGTIPDFLKRCFGKLPHGCSIDCTMEWTDVPSYDKILWKVKNVGAVAEKKDMIRGQIEERGKSIHEHSDFFGPHYIECYIVKGNRCLAIGHIEVPIDDK
jgi:hypothetical protein